MTPRCWPSPAPSWLWLAVRSRLLFLLAPPSRSSPTCAPSLPRRRRWPTARARRLLRHFGPPLPRRRRAAPRPPPPHRPPCTMYTRCARADDAARSFGDMRERTLSRSRTPARTTPRAPSGRWLGRGEDGPQGAAPPLGSSSPSSSRPRAAVPAHRCAGVALKVFVEMQVDQKVRFGGCRWGAASPKRATNRVRTGHCRTRFGGCGWRCSNILRLSIFYTALSICFTSTISPPVGRSTRPYPLHKKTPDGGVRSNCSTGGLPRSN